MSVYGGVYTNEHISPQHNNRRRSVLGQASLQAPKIITKNAEDKTGVHASMRSILKFDDLM